MRNLYKPPRYNVASIQVQQTLGGDVMVADENGNYIEWRDYQWLLTEKQRLDSECQARQAENSVLAVECDSLKAEVENSKRINTELLALSNRQASEIRRLTKAGDLMCRMAGNNQVINRHWKTAKKGVQS